MQKSSSAAAATGARKKQRTAQSEDSKPCELPLLLSVPSVECDPMDKEHEECVEALNALANHGSVANVRKLIQVVEAHFDHEEALLDEQFYRNEGKGEDASFSFAEKAKANARSTHYSDHARILQMLNAEVLAATKAGMDTVAPEVCQRFMDAFETHATTYDIHYAGHVH